MDGPNRQAKRPRRAAAAAEGRLPPEVFAAVGAFCCRSSLDALMCTSKQIRAVCSGLPKPWPTNRGCPLVEMVCPDNTELPTGPQSQCDENFGRYAAQLRSFTPPPTGLIMFHAAAGTPFLFLQNGGIRPLQSSYIKARVLQIWSKESGLMYEETKSYTDKPAITPPLDESGSQFVVLSRSVRAATGVRMVELNVPSSHGARQTVRSFSLPCNDIIETFRCVGGSNGPCLIFMDRGESAVKLCRMRLEEGTGQCTEGNLNRLVLTEPVKLVSDPNPPSRMPGDLNMRRSSLAVDSRRGIIAFSYDFEDKQINIYDMKRKVTVVVPVREGAGWIREVEFSPDGEMLVVAHCTLQHWHGNSSCAMSLYDCSDMDRIECITERPSRLFLMKGIGYCDNLAFSPRGKMLSFRWHPEGHDYTGTVFERERVGMIDLSPLKDGAGDGQISFEILGEIAQWEKFVRS